MTSPASQRICNLSTVNPMEQTGDLAFTLWISFEDRNPPVWNSVRFCGPRRLPDALGDRD